MTIDLHCHTKMSDGSASINELVELARLRKIDVISVTDHDTFAGSVRAGILGKRKGVNVVLGAEISALDKERNRKVHMLCYNPQSHERLEGLLKKITANRKTAMTLSIQKVLHMYPMPIEMILARANGSTNIFKQHIMQGLMDAGYTDQMFGDVFKKLFHPRFGLAYTHIEYPDVRDVITEIHAAGGAAVLAHPSEYDSTELMVELCEKNLIEGVEVFHPRNSPEDLAPMQACCSHFGKFMTGGTDFHGSYTTSCHPLGTYLTPGDQFDILRKWKPKN